MKALPTVSVVIPTFNRKDFLVDALDSLAQQTYPFEKFEIIIIDDGSLDDTRQVEGKHFPFTLHYFWQSNQGDAAARNLGAQESEADILVFIDDDILVERTYLDQLIGTQIQSQNCIVVGRCHLLPENATPLARNGEPSPADYQTSALTELNFRDVFSNNMAIWRDAYLRIGMMRSLGFSGSDMWCDLEFSYRAYRQGFKFIRNNLAQCWHRDHSISELEVHTRRMKTASYRAVLLFQEFPELLSYVPMFSDKTPIAWGKDPIQLISRKLVRVLTSSRLVLWSLEQIVTAFQKRGQASVHLLPLYRWIIGGYIFQGYREGLRDFGPVNA